MAISQREACGHSGLSALLLNYPASEPSSSARGYAPILSRKSTSFYRNAKHQIHFSMLLCSLAVVQAPSCTSGHSTPGLEWVAGDGRSLLSGDSGGLAMASFQSQLIFQKHPAAPHIRACRSAVQTAGAGTLGVPATSSRPALPWNFRPCSWWIACRPHSLALAQFELPRVLE